MDSGMKMYNETHLQQVQSWLEKVVIGLNFCPFARKPYEDKRVRIVCEQVTEDDAVLEVVLRELLDMEKKPASELETTLLVLPYAYPNFIDFNGMLAVLNNVLELEGFEGLFQIASFHPAYQFAGTQVTDRENLTNRAPFPILHFLREESIERVLARYSDDPQRIPESNIKRLNKMTHEELKGYFTYLF